MSQHHQQDCIEVLIEKAKRGQVSRRSFLSAMGVLAAMPLAMRSNISWAADKPLVLVNWGGDAINAFADAFTKSFTKATGIQVKIDGSGPTDGAVRTQAASGRPTWDIVDTDYYTSISLGREGLLAPIDYNIVDKTKVLPNLAGSHGVGGYQFSYVLAWDSERYGDNGPKNWVDFFDTQRFPGKRTMYKWMNGVLEAALLADGVPADQLYPLDVARALNKLDELRPHIVSFWGSGAESQQLMLEGEASMGHIWSTRAMLIEQDTEGRVKWDYENAFVNASSWAVLANNPGGSHNAMSFIDSALDPQKQIMLLDSLGNGTTNPQAQALMTPAQRAMDAGSPENLAKQIALNVEWYVDNYGPTLDKFLSKISS